MKCPVLLRLVALMGAFAAASGAAQTLRDNPYQGVSLSTYALLQNRLNLTAETGCRQLAGIYASANRERYPGLSEFGRQLQVELDGAKRPLDFNRLVGSNPVCWRAERELSLLDPSFPYLISMLAVLGNETVTAQRLIALAQSTLPLNPAVRRIYSQPEGMMSFLNFCVCSGLDRGIAALTEEECQIREQALRVRITRWPGQPRLVQTLIAIEARRGELAGTANKVSICQSLGLTDSDLFYLSKHDPILADALAHDLQQ